MKYLFYHLHKTGGSALHKFFERLLGKENITPLNYSAPIQPALHDYSNKPMISGHIDFSKTNFLPSNRYKITILREPIDRFISSFYYYRNNVGGLHISNPVKAKNLEEYVFDESESSLQMMSNFQTQRLFTLGCNDLNDLPILGIDQLDAARKALDRFDIVGVYHEFNDFLDLLCYECSWPPIKKIPRQNVTRNRPKLSEVDLKIIHRLEELNQLDLALYDYATQLFNEKKRQVLHECIERRHREIYNSSSPPSPQDASSPLIPLPEEERKPTTEALPPANFGNHQVEIINIKIKGAVSLTNTLFSGEEIAIRVIFRAHIDVENLTVGIHIHDRSGRLVFGTNSKCLGHALHIRTGGTYFVDYRFRNDLGIGAYTIGAALHIGNNHLSGCFHWRDEVTCFEVIGNIGYHFEGIAKLYPQLRCGILGDNPADIQILPAAHDWPRLQQIAIHTPKLTEFRAQICLLQALEQLRPNEVIAIEAEITNTSGQTWRSIGQNPVHLSHHWQNLSGEWLEFDGLRTPLPYDIAPGETFRHYLTIKSPSQSGDALLQLTLVQEGVAWFDKQGCPPLEIRVRIGE